MRVAWARKHLHWTEADWLKVLFSDEKSFKGEGFSGQVWCRRPKGEAGNPMYQVPYKPHPVKVHVWGCITGKGMGYCHIFNGTLNKIILGTILQANLIPSAKLFFSFDPPEQWYFQQDNDPKHTSNHIMTWLHNHGVTLLDWPPYSPDLNPIENVWADMARRVEKRYCPTMEILQDVVAEEWAATSTELLQTLTSSMHTRCELVIAVHGQYIKY